MIEAEVSRRNGEIVVKIVKGSGQPARDDLFLRIAKEAGAAGWSVREGQTKTYMFEAPLLPPVYDLPERLPRLDQFQEIVRRITEIRINYGFPDVHTVIQISDASEIAEVTRIFRSNGLVPSAEILALGGEPFISAYDHGRKIFDLRWQSYTKIVVFSDPLYARSGAHDWGGAYEVTPEWRRQYLDFCAEMLARKSRRPNQPPQPGPISVALKPNLSVG